LFVALKMKSSKEAKDEERAVRVAFRWRKASVPNHLLPMLYIRILCLNWNMERPPRTTVLPQAKWLCLSQLLRNFSMWYALPERGWRLTGDCV
jgi:hypothetical protein